MKFVRDNQQICLTFFESTPVAIDLPTVVVLKVTEAEMSAKGNTVNQDKKRAVCETGLEIKVPPFVDSGEYIKVSTETESLCRGPKRPTFSFSSFSLRSSF